MRGTIRTIVLGFAFATLCVPLKAHAEAFIGPWGGVVFGNDQVPSGLRAVGVTFGDAGHGLVGTETTIGVAPGFFGSAANNYLLDVMAGFTIGPTFASKTDHDTRTYGLVEFGTIRTSIDGIGTGARFARNDIGIEVGGGTTIALNHRFLVRGELRYIRTIHTNDAANSLNVNLADFHFWRTAFGVTIH